MNPFPCHSQPLSKTCLWTMSNVELEDKHMIYTERRKRENLQGKTRGLMGRSEQGMGLGTHREPVTCMRASIGFVVGVRVVFGMVVSPVLGASIPVIMKLIFGSAAMEPPKLLGNSPGCRGIHLDRTFWLGPTHGDEGLVVGNHFSCSDEQRC
jgi:hypothetical protein